jgi:nucleotide-binding universal stress UspA family protein
MRCLSTCLASGLKYEGAPNDCLALGRGGVFGSPAETTEAARSAAVVRVRISRTHSKPPATARSLHPLAHMKKLLTAMDGSDASMHAARKALEIADAMGADVTLAHVVPFVFLPAEVPFDTGALADQALKAGELLLTQAASELGRPSLARICLRGSPAEALAESAEQGGFDLLVVGSKGRGAVSRVLLGSTSDRVVHICHKPVLVVR